MACNCAKKKLTCARCGDEITHGCECGTEASPLCEECYQDLTDVCPVCEEHFTPLDGEDIGLSQTREGEEYFFITKATAKVTRKPVGLYHVLEWPFFYGDCVTGFDGFIEGAIEQVNTLDIEDYLDRQYPRIQNTVGTDIICPECAEKYKNMKVED